MSDVELIDRLVDLGDQLEREVVAGDLADAVLATIEAQWDGPTPRRVFARRAALLSLAAAAVLIVTLLVAIPGPRHTIARWFGIGSVRIEPAASIPSSRSTGTDGTSDVVPATTTTGAAPGADGDPLGLGRPVGAEEAVAATGLPLPLAPALGAPESFHLPGGPQIAARYDVSGRTVLVVVLAGTTDEPLFVKEVRSDQISPVEVPGADGASIAALWIEGEPHSFGYVDADGKPGHEVFRLAGDTLLWERDGRTWRVEGARDLAEALEIASSMER
jgi:hypothetical protein